MPHGLFLIPILHQTTTITSKYGQNRRCFSFQFYIKPQHPGREPFHAASCFSFQFYIKPQHDNAWVSGDAVVSHSNSTSNHNREPWPMEHGGVVSHSNSTSNHNKGRIYNGWKHVVSHSNSTSNHNLGNGSGSVNTLFLIPILHQTTTHYQFHSQRPCCFSFQFYIKPQRCIPYDGSA